MTTAVQKAARRPTKTDILQKSQKQIRDLYGLNRLRVAPPSTGTTVSLGGTPSAAGASGGTGNFLKTMGDTMIGPIAFFPQTVAIKDGAPDNDSIDIGQDSGTGNIPDYSTYVFVSSAATDDLELILGAGFSGQWLIIQTNLTTTVTVEDFSNNTAGNIVTPDGNNIVLDGTTAGQTLQFIFDVTVSPNGNSGGWRVIAQGAGGGGGSNVPSGTAVNDHIEWDGAAWIAQQTLEFNSTGAQPTTGFLRFPNDNIGLSWKAVDTGDLQVKADASDRFDFTDSSNGQVTIQLRAQDAVVADKIGSITQAGTATGRMDISTGTGLDFALAATTQMSIAGPASTGIEMFDFLDMSGNQVQDLTALVYTGFATDGKSISRDLTGSGAINYDLENIGALHVFRVDGNPPTEKLRIAASGVVLSTTLDLNGENLVLDLDGDTSIQTPTDDEVVIVLGPAAQQFQFIADTAAFKFDINSSSIEFNEIAVPPVPLTTDAKVFFDAADDTLKIIHSTASGKGTVSLEASGGTDSPWTVDHDAAGFKLKDLGATGGRNDHALNFPNNQKIGWENIAGTANITLHVNAIDDFTFDWLGATGSQRMVIDAVDDIRLMIRSANNVAGENIGRFIFQGEDATPATQEYALIDSFIRTATAGSEAGSLAFRVTEGGTTNVLYMEMRGDSATVNVAKNIAMAGNDIVQLDNLSIDERVGDPAVGANEGVFYAKDSAGNTRPFWDNNTEAPVDLTTGSGGEFFGPWTADHNAGAFDLTNIKFLEGRDTGVSSFRVVFDPLEDGDTFFGDSGTADRINAFVGGANVQWWLTTQQVINTDLFMNVGNDIDMNGNLILNASVLQSNATTPADLGNIRLGNAESIQWRQTGAFNASFSFDGFDDFVMNFGSLTGDANTIITAIDNVVLRLRSDNNVAALGTGFIIFEGDNVTPINHEYGRILNVIRTTTAGAEAGSTQFGVHQAGANATYMELRGDNLDVDFFRDLDINGNSVKEIDTLEFLDNVTAPATNIGAIYYENTTTGMNFNAITGDDFTWRVNGAIQAKLDVLSLSLGSMAGGGEIECNTYESSSDGVVEITMGTSGMGFGVNVGDVFTWTISGGATITMSGVNWDMNGNNLIDTGDIRVDSSKVRAFSGTEIMLSVRNETGATGSAGTMIAPFLSATTFPSAATLNGAFGNLNGSIGSARDNNLGGPNDGRFFFNVNGIWFQLFGQRV